MAEDGKKEEELGTNGEAKPEEVVKKPEEFIQFPPAGSTPVTVPDGQHGLVIVDGAYAEEITLKDGTGVILYVPISKNMDRGTIVAAMATNADEKEEPKKDKDKDKDKGGPVGGVVPIPIPVPVGGGTRTEGGSTEPKEEPKKETEPKEEPKKQTEANKPKEEKKKKIWIPIVIGAATIGITLTALFWPIKEKYIVHETVVTTERVTQSEEFYHNGDSTSQLVDATNRFGQETEANGRISGEGIPDGGAALHAAEQRAVSTGDRERAARELVDRAISEMENGNPEGLGMFAEGIHTTADIYEENAPVVSDMHERAEEALNRHPDDTTTAEIDSLHTAREGYNYEANIAHLNDSSAETLDRTMSDLASGKINSVENIQVTTDPDGDRRISYDEVREVVEIVPKEETKTTNLWHKMMDYFRQRREARNNSSNTQETPTTENRSTEEDERG